MDIFVESAEREELEEIEVLLRNLCPYLPSLGLPRPPSPSPAPSSTPAPPSATLSPVPSVASTPAPPAPSSLEPSQLLVFYEASLTVDTAILEPDVILEVEGDATPGRTAAHLPTGRSPPVICDSIPDCDLGLLEPRHEVSVTPKAIT